MNCQTQVSDWDGFSERIKHYSRYFLALESSKGQPGNDGRDSRTFLDRLGNKVVELGLVTRLDTGQPLYRARHVKEGQTLETFDELGPPPRHQAIAGRMNPAGISYFYLAKEQSTAIGEILAKPPARIAVGEFRPRQDCWVLDLTKLPDAPSAFDIDQYRRRQSIVFLNEFVEHVSMPVTKDGREHVEYVPSQAVSEFFAQVFCYEGERIRGMIYPSALVPSGNNLVLFPPSALSSWEQGTELVSAYPIHVNDWADVNEVLRPNN